MAAKALTLTTTISGRRGAANIRKRTWFGMRLTRIGSTWFPMRLTSIGCTGSGLLAKQKDRRKIPSVSSRPALDASPSTSPQLCKHVGFLAPQGMQISTDVYLCVGSAEGSVYWVKVCEKGCRYACTQIQVQYLNQSEKRTLSEQHTLERLLVPEIDAFHKLLYWRYRLR
ncbi:hypothetical protein DFH07DRAFT_799744 [Mycena maculata]|uniref:Uncharacterized protein n=1 Tax=Mycena maculata TaxID=230809 RepID=A0AAD7JYH2_9AGAR|nr:hypothetical protein DFH07DRAFT_799744 [Mycena maculata]